MRSGRLRLAGLTLALILAFSIEVKAQQNDVHLYFFTNDGCAPCRQVEPAIEALKQEGYPVTTLYASRSLEATQRFQIDRTPTVIMVANQRVVGRHAGLIDAVTLKQWFTAVGVRAGSRFQGEDGKPISSGNQSGSG